MSNEENIKSMSTKDLASYLIRETVNKKGVATFITSDNTEFRARSDSDEDYDLAATDASEYEINWLKQEM